MRPSVEEQLLGTCRILETVVAPAVAEPFARTILDNLIANLRMVTEALPAVPGFLRWDNAATQDLLHKLRGAVPPELAGRIDAAVSARDPDGDRRRQGGQCHRHGGRGAVRGQCLADGRGRAIVGHRDAGFGFLVVGRQSGGQSKGALGRIRRTGVPAG